MSILMHVKQNINRCFQLFTFYGYNINGTCRILVCNSYKQRLMDESIILSKTDQVLPLKLYYENKIHICRSHCLVIFFFSLKTILNEGRPLHSK